MSKSKKRQRGVISVHRRGFGFVNDIFIPKPFLLGAVDGDTVEVVTKPGKRGKGPEGEVIKIVERARDVIVGTIVKQMGPKEFSAIAPILGTEDPVLVKAGKVDLNIGTRLTMKVEEWGSEGELTLCSATKVIGHIDNPSDDVPCAIAEFELRTTFSKEIELPTGITEQEKEGRKDYRKLTTVTIDPATAKDFDDALSLTQEKNGDLHLIVHIADVSHYVRPGTLVDDEAVKRCNSTYFPNTCIPMLPPKLADDLCSLKPNVDRLAVSVSMLFSKEGKLKKHSIDKSVIHSDQRFSYEEAAEVLAGTTDSPHKELLQTMVTMCELLKGDRRRRGSVELAMPEVVLNVDDQGVPTGTRVVDYDITHQMVEEFMLKANEMVATHISKKGHGLTYRIHEEPDAKSLRDFSQMAQAFGFSLPTSPKMTDLQDLFKKAMGHPNGYYLAVGYIRSMKLAIYSPDNIGHYGLSLDYYCHFTSPIRRYPDLVAHRILFGNPYDDEPLAQISKLCSEAERKSSRAEMSVMRLKKLRYLKQQWEVEPHRQFQTIVSRVKPAGITFEIVGLMLEGFIRISNLGHDWFGFNPRTQALEGEKSGRRFACGSELNVSVREIELPTGEVEWYLS